jgi:ABC-type dipeptide/oligopeptide/nickel transport system permease component
MSYIFNRLLSIALTLFLISVITFAVTTILPGDVATMIMGTQSNPEALAGLRKTLASMIRLSFNMDGGSAAC